MNNPAEKLLEKIQNSQNHEEAVKIIDEFLDEARNDGFEEGRTEGYDEGFSDGENEAGQA